MLLSSLRAREETRGFADETGWCAVWRGLIVRKRLHSRLLVCGLASNHVATGALRGPVSRAGRKTGNPCVRCVRCVREK
jgi:hypothetical protein